jgi:hypothetical protein
MVHGIIWKADCHSACQKISHFLMEPEGSSPCSQKPATGPYLSQPNQISPIFQCLGRSKESVQVRGALKHFVTIKNFYGEWLWPHAQPPSWRTTPYRLSATAYSIYSQLPSVLGRLPSIRNLRTRHAVVTRDSPNMARHNTYDTLCTQSARSERIWRRSCLSVRPYARPHASFPKLLIVGQFRWNLALPKEEGVSTNFSWANSILIRIGPI